jgi:hypothetical protein
MKTYQILIARYKEPLNWLEYLPEAKQRNYEIIVSNSGDAVGAVNADKVIQIENLGREAGHYLNFMANERESMKDCVIFMQANPWPHATPETLLSLFYGNPEFPFEMSFLGCNQPICIERVPRWTEAEHILLSGWKSRSWPKEKHGGKPWVIGGGAQFYIKKQVILKRPPEHYMGIWETARDPDSKLAHVLEFHWPNVFALT